MQLLASYLSGAWSAGAGPTVPLINPATEAVLAEVHTGGHDLAAAFRYARTTGGAELGALGFAQRGALLGALAKAVHGAREELIALAVGNGGNTRGDAKFDVDGGALSLSHHAELGARLRTTPSSRLGPARPGSCPTAIRSRSAARRGWAASTSGRAAAASPSISTRST